MGSSRQKLGIAVISNLANFGPGTEARKIAALYLGNTLEAEPRPESIARTFTNAEPSELEAYVGIYPLPQISQTVHVVTDKGKLWFSGPIKPAMELRPMGFMRNVTFLRDDANDITAVLVGGGRVREIRFVRKAPTIDSHQLASPLKDRAAGSN